MNPSTTPLINIGGPSGIGKTSVLRALLKQFPDAERLVTTTSRPPRPHERDGIDYYFIAEAEFKNRLAANAFLEHYFFPERGVYYGVERQVLETMLARNVLIFSAIEIHGWRVLKATYPDALGIYLLPANENQVREQYLQRDPKMDPAMLAERLRASAAELEEGKPEYTIHVVNHPGKLPETVHTIAAIIAKTYPLYV
jgi:guanylate kinase